MSPQLRAALDDAYKAFADMPAPTHLDASPLRDAKKILRTLTARPLRELTNEEIGPYSGWAMTTVGNEQDYRHFLPRILELSVSDPAWIGSEPPVIASRLLRADWRHWPENQQHAVTVVFYAAFDLAIRSNPELAAASASDWLCGIARLGFPITDLLAGWRQSTTLESTLQLAWLVGFFDGLETIPPFWEEAPPLIRHEIHAWVIHPHSYDQLAKSVTKAPEEDRWPIERALRILSASTARH